MLKKVACTMNSIIVQSSSVLLHKQILLTSVVLSGVDILFNYFYNIISIINCDQSIEYFFLNNLNNAVKILREHKMIKNESLWAKNMINEILSKVTVLHIL